MPDAQAMSGTQMHSKKGTEMKAPESGRQRTVKNLYEIAESKRPPF